MYIYKCLEPYTEYQIYIKAKDENNFSEPSETINQYTDVDGPGPPVIINATCLPGTSGTSIFLQWAPPENLNRSVDEYIIYVSKDSNNVQKFKFPLQKDSLDFSVCK